MSIFIRTHAANVRLYGDTLATVTLKSGTGQGCAFVFGIELEVLTSTVTQEKEINVTRLEREQQKPSLFIVVMGTQKSPENGDQLRV